MMRTKILLLVITLPLLSIKAKAGLTAGFGVYAGYNASVSKHATFDQFCTTYSAYNQPGRNIKEEMKPWGFAMGGMTIGVQARSKFFGADINYTSVKNSTVAEFINGEKRHFDLKQSWVCTGFSLGPNSKHFFLIAEGGIGFGDALINCYYEYNDGTKSYGQETLLSSEYHSISIAPYYGGKLGITVGKFTVFGQATHFGSGFDNNRTVMDDIADAGSLGPSEYPGGLPLDYGAYVNSTSNYDYGTENYVKADIKTWKFTVGVELTFGNSED
jgi:hypothetical protein